MKRILYLFYNYYNSGFQKDTAYFNTLFAIAAMLNFNIATLFMIFTGRVVFVEYLPTSEALTLAILLLYLVACMLVIYLLYPKKSVATYNYTGNIKIHGWLLFCYFVFSFLIFTYAVAHWYVR
jgi:hypothetical protein